MKNDDKKFKIKLCLLWVFAFSVIIFMMTFTSHAETYDNTLPFKYSSVDNFNSFLTDDLLECIDDANLPVYDENYILILRDIGFVSANPVGYRFYFDLLPISTFTSYSNDIYTSSVPFSIDTTKTKHRFYVGVLFSWNGSELVPYQYGVNGKSTSFTATTSLFGHSPFTYTTGDTGKKPNWNVSFYYPCYFSKDFYFNNQKVLSYGTGTPVDVGVAIIPPEAFIPDYLSGDTAPSNVPPSYTINNYSWTTAPSFDGSSVINGIQSIKDTLEWLADNLKNAFSNLLNNLKGLTDYIGKTIQYYGNAIIETINNAIQNFYDNMKSLVEPIYNQLKELQEGFVEFADLFIHPFDQEEFEAQIDNCQLITQYQELKDNSDIIREVLANAEENDSFIIYIDFENPFADSEHKIIHGQISFNWLVPLRSIYRPFLTVFTLLECFVGGFRLLGNIIGGKAK